ncbi:hypothetical protein EVAR_43638_1 [Eumeta japonica]|uniref:Uncharacterized protein n=1 Tax=Eumeta variegata TaxID=151549 RepID=A0A4C1ZHK6_EUMVA|nr:hypothetical protein EVAR_43638_1 [Eumeta japonica]
MAGGNRTFVGKQNVKLEPIVEAEKVLIPPLRIKLGSMKEFVKKLDETSEAFGAMLRLTWLQHENKLVRPVEYRNLTKHRCEVTAFAVAFRLASESSGDPWMMKRTIRSYSS